jgi:hypothetical protein
MGRPIYARVVSGPVPTLVCVRIVVLQSDTEIWCEPCGLAAATRITYVAEDGAGPPQSVRQLAYCESCENR